MTRPIFDKEELRFKDNSMPEQRRTWAIFIKLKDLVDRGIDISEQEKEYIYSSVRTAAIDLGSPLDYPCCENPHFNMTYLRFFHDLSGGGIYKDILKGEIITTPRSQVEEELKYLYKKADYWESIINDCGHSDELLKIVSQQTREELRKFNKQPEIKNKIFGANRRQVLKVQLLLRSHFLYLKTLDILESTSSNELYILLNGQNIEINEYSLFHIVYNHFSAITRYYDYDKSYHMSDFMPDILGQKLQNIISEIENSKLYIGIPIEMIAFRFNNVDYQLYTSMRTKNVKGKGPIKYRRLDTFYPLTKDSQKQKLVSACELVFINDNLSLYIPKN